jgi:tetratricopeptide (TPR) repeat protein
MTKTPIEETFARAHEHHRSGRLADAETMYRQILALSPEHADSLHLLGLIAHQTGRSEDAVQFLERAIHSNPNFAKYHSNLGVVLAANGGFDRAVREFRKVVELQQDYPEGYANLARALRDAGRVDEAVDVFRHAIATQPDALRLCFQLANLLVATGRPALAIAEYQACIALKPDFADAMNNLGLALRELNRPAEEEAAYRQAIAIRPACFGAINNLGSALLQKNELDDAISMFRQAVVLKPEMAQAHYNLATALLSRGDFDEGWHEYEWRIQTHPMSRYRQFRQPRWTGQPLYGKTILLHAEQGFGDTLQFCRYAPLVAQAGGQVVLACQKELCQLMTSLNGVAQIVPNDAPTLPDFDFHCPLPSLPLVFKTTLQSIPSAIPYIHADPELSRRYRQRLSAASAKLKIGIAWAGSPTHGNDRHRSMPLAEFALLGSVQSEAWFCGLQKGRAVEQLCFKEHQIEIEDFSAGLGDFAETAALVANVDLVISVDTSLIHLAGALGKPVWVLLAFAPDFRWMLRRDDSPWYPSARLFRQAKPGDWDSVMKQVADMLKKMATPRRSH